MAEDGRLERSFRSEDALNELVPPVLRKLGARGAVLVVDMLLELAMLRILAGVLSFLIDGGGGTLIIAGTGRDNCGADDVEAEYSFKPAKGLFSDALDAGERGRSESINLSDSIVGVDWTLDMVTTGDVLPELFSSIIRGSASRSLSVE